MTAAWELKQARGFFLIFFLIAYSAMPEQLQNYIYYFGSEGRNPGLLLPDTKPVTS